MVRIVFVKPPAVAESQQKIGMNQAKRFISSRVAENFLMARVVDDKSQLCEYESQESGVEKFNPGVVKCLYQQESTDQQKRVKKDFPAVINRLLGQ